jgi:predicted ABC-type ATPase
VVEPPQPACFYVLDGTNGAGKSSIIGAMFLKQGVEFFNPDEASRRISAANSGISRAEANSIAWHEGKRLLERAITERLDFAFETTLGGRTITPLLTRALAEGIEVRVWYVGLSSVDLHIARVRARVEHGGHEIPEDRIRERYTSSRLNLIRLLPKLTELLLYDNTEEGDPKIGEMPKPKLIIHLVQGKMKDACDLTKVPEWAKSIVAAAMNLGD